MFSEKIKDLKNKRKKYKKEKLEKKKRAERRKRREAKRKLDEKKALEKKKKLQARRKAIEDEKNAKIKVVEGQNLAKEREIKKQQKKQMKETKKFLKQRKKKHKEYLEIKKKMERNSFEKDVRKKSKVGFAWIIFLLICIACLAYSSYQIFIWVRSTEDLQTIEEEVIGRVVTEVKDNSKEHSIEIDFDELTKINSDVVGWIYIKDTDINYPIMQAKDNNYYLKKNIYKEYSSCGSIFLDCNTDSFYEDNTVVYGHNLKNQKMFADLKKVYDGEFGKDVYIEVFDTNNTFIKYKILATYMVEPTLEVVKKDFKISEKKKYIDNAYEQSTVKFNCGFNYQKDLLTLVTCDNTGDKRIIVNALRVN